MNQSFVLRVSVYLCSVLVVLTTNIWAAESGRIIERGPHHRTWEVNRESFGKNIRQTTARIVEVEGGMHRQTEGGEWVPASSRLELFKDGAVLRGAQFRAIFSASLAQPGSIDIETSDGGRLAGNPLCLLLSEGGKSVTIAEIQDCAGEIVGADQNTLIYRNAFTDYAIDIEYRIGKASLSQWVVLHEAIDPREYGFTDSAVLELLTEWTTMPDVRRNAREWVAADAIRPALTDERISVGAMEFVTGKAFAVGGADAEAVPVAKTLESFDGNRVCLVEKIPFQWIAAELQKLPKPEAAQKTRRAAQMAVKRGSHLPVLRQAAAAGKAKPVRMAAIRPRTQPAFIVDFELASSVASMTWRGDTTYYISGPITVTTNVFERGCVIKMAPTNSAKLTINGPVTCHTSAYGPVIFTARDERSVGQLITTNDLSGGYYADVGLELDYNTSGVLYNLENFRISHAQTAVKIIGGYGHSLKHFQIVHAGTGLSIQNADVSFRNMLAYDVSTAFSGAGASSATGRLENVTVTLSSNFNAGGNCTLFLTNSLLIGVTNIGSYSGSSNAERLDPDGVFDKVGAGYAYLAATNTIWRNAGTPSINPTLFQELGKRTTLAPAILTNMVVGSTNLLPRSIADVGDMDLGYHYPLVDYACKAFGVTNGTLVLSNGVVVMSFGVAAIWTIDNSTLISIGTPLVPNHLTRFNVIQEQSTNWGEMYYEVSGNNTVICYNYSNSPPHAQIRFTDFELMADSGYHFQMLDDTWTFSTVAIRDSSFYSGRQWFGGWEIATVGLTNNLFHRVNSYFGYYSTLGVYNNLFLGGGVEIDKFSGTNSWIFKDNAFDATAITNLWNYTTNTHNAYLNGAGRLPPTNMNDVVVATFSHTNGPLGRFYQMGTSLKDKGSLANAGLRGLYHFTTSADQPPNKEGFTTVDIGLHYVAADSSGNPLDSDADGTPDYLEDTNGNGLGEPSEFSALKLWLIANNGLTTNGSGNISAWADQSGNANNASQATATLQPLSVANVVNGRSIVRFDNADDALNLPNFMAGFSGAEAFAVVKAASDSPAASRRLWKWGTSSSVVAYPNTSGQIVDDLGSSLGRTLGDPSQALDQFSIYNVSLTSTSWAARLNGALIYDDDTNSISFNTAPQLGGTLDGDVAEVLVFNSALSSYDRSAVGRYLNANYALISAPVIPTNLVATAISSNQISLTWGPSLNKTSITFQLERKLGSQPYEVIASLENTASYVDSGLTPGITYYYRVKGINFAGESGYSDEAFATPVAGLPSMPVSQLTLWLKGDAGHTGGYITYWVDAATKTNHAVQLLNPTRRPVAVENQINGRPVIRFDGGDDSMTFWRNPFWGLAEAEAVIVLKTSADPISGFHQLGTFGNGAITYYPSSDGSIRNGFGTTFGYNEGDPTRKLDEYHIYSTAAAATGQRSSRINGILYHGITNATMGFPASPTIGSSSGSFSGDIVEFQIYRRVLTVAERYAVGRYLGAKYNLFGIPVTPSNLTAKAISSNQISVAWTALLTNRATRFIIERKVGIAGAYAVLDSTDNVSSYIDATVIAGTEYYYRVKAADYGGESGYSNEANATPRGGETSLPTSNIILWFKGDGGHDDGRFSLWEDLSGNWNHADTHLVNVTPFSVNSAMSGRPVVRFYSTNTLPLPIKLFDGILHAELAVVLKAALDDPTGDRRLALLGGGTGTTYPRNAAEIRDDFASTINYFVGDPAQPLDQPHYYGVSASLDGAWTARINGVPIYTFTSNIVDFSSAPAVGGGGGGFDGDIAELIIFNGSLTPAERHSLGRYLNHKYGFVTNAPVAPGGLSIVAESANDLRVGWTNVSATSTEYVVERKVSSTGAFASVGAAWDTQSFRNTGTLPGTNYYYRVRAVNYLGDSAYSEQISPPMATVTNPASAVALTTGTNYTVGGNAADSDGSVTQVVLYANSQVLGTFTNSPYSVTWTNPFPTSYALWSKAWDNAGNTRISANVFVTLLQDTDGDGVNDFNEIANGTNPYATDTDGDGVADNLDAFPLDPGRSSLPTPSGDTTPPTIILDEPAEATPAP